MEHTAMYLMKSLGVLVLFLGCYHVFLRKTTFFLGNRWFLLGGLLFSLVVPFITITKTIYVDAVQTTLSLPENASVVDSSVQADNTSWDWGSIALTLYLIGVVFFGLQNATATVPIKKNYQKIKMCWSQEWTCFYGDFKRRFTFLFFQIHLLQP